MSSEAVGRPMEILLVEDSLTSARVTMGALKKGGVQHRLTWITDGEEALAFVFKVGKYAQAPRPDLILLDLELPKRDGREVLATIKSDFDLKTIPVVVVTASTDEEDRIRSELLEVENYITKPVNLKKFVQVVNELKQFWHEGIIVPTTD